MRIVSYNIRKAVGLDRRRDPMRVQGVIAATGADIVVLQEADRRLPPRPAALPPQVLEAETRYRIAPVAATDVSLGWHGNAVLVREGLRITAIRRLPLPGLEPRGAVLVQVDGAAIGPITVVGAHLALLRRWRRRQLRALRDHVAPESRAATIIAGDFNEWSDANVFAPLGRDFTVVSPGRSFHAAYPVAALDRFAHGTGLRVAQCGVIRTGHARQASDHLPVWAEFARTR